MTAHKFTYNHFTLSHWHFIFGTIVLLFVIQFYRVSFSEHKPIISSIIDLDGNGIPDNCAPDGHDTFRCILVDGTTTTLAAPPAIVTSTTAWPPSATESSYSDLPSGTLPSSKQFEADNGTKWSIEYVQHIKFTGELGQKNLYGDKCRSSELGGKIIWSCGDMWCDGDYQICGFAYNPAMYGTSEFMTVNTTGITAIYDNDFLKPWKGDPAPKLPFKFWGMDTSNIVAINDTHGIVYGYEVWRGTGKDQRRGNAIAWVTLGEDKPIATRVGPRLTGPEAIEMGMLAILRDDQYIYIYSAGGPSRLIVTRVSANEDVFDRHKYETLKYNIDVWEKTIPKRSTKKHGMATMNNRKFSCLVYGSVFYNNYLRKYVIVCNIYMVATNMYTSDTPWGPWSEEYGLLRGWKGYGSMVHPWASPDGSHKTIYFTQGNNTGFDVFKVVFNYDDLMLSGE